MNLTQWDKVAMHACWVDLYKGQWPAGLSKQLLAEAAEPYLRRLSGVHLEELVRSLQGLLKAKR